jgi:hypothetical protein
MSFTDNYEPDYGNSGLKAGEYEAVIDRAEETVSKTGKDMIKVNLLIEGRKFLWCIVEGNWFNSNCTKFCVCFGIKPGNFDYEEWRGKRGTVGICVDGNNPDYFKVKYLVAPGSGVREPENRRNEQQRPEYNRQQQQPVKDRSLPPNFSDDIPF